MEGAPSEKPVILVLTGHYLPGYKAGGPIQSIANIVELLGDEFDFQILTADRDLSEKGPYPGIMSGRWMRVGKANVLYLRPDLTSLCRLFRLLRQSVGTVLYLNSVLDRKFSMLPSVLRWLRIIRPGSVLIAPRGEFSTGALRIKRFPKWAFITLAKWLGLYRGVLWHACSESEGRDIRRELGTNVTIITAPAVSTLRTTGDTGRSKERGKLSLVFLSRISRKKNLDGALQMLHALQGRVSFHIYGLAEDTNYWKECQEVARRLPPNIHVEYAGFVPHEQVGEVLARHHLFFLPTHGENYGHVICEALAAGCPVLISDQTPWRKLEESGVGWDIPLSRADQFRTVLERCVQMAPDEFRNLSTRARIFGLARLNDIGTIKLNRELFLRVTHHCAERLPPGGPQHSNMANSGRLQGSPAKKKAV